MSAPARIATFLSILLAAFAVAYAIGLLAGPISQG